MKKGIVKLSTLLLATMSFFVATVTTGWAQETYENDYPPYVWVVESFDSVMTLHEDTSFSVQETIKVDFQDLEKRGIYRDIQTHYDGMYGSKFTMRLHVESVTDEHGLSQPYALMREGDLLRIRIGDPDIYHSGKMIYVITYDVQGAYTLQKSAPTANEKDHIEYFWNTTGEWFDSPIIQAATTVKIPFATSDLFEGLKTKCFTGYFGSTQENCSIEVLPSKKEVHFAADDELKYGHMLSTVLSFPNSYVVLPTFFEKVVWFISDNWILLLPLLLLCYILYKWWYFGKERSMKSIVPVWHPPEGMSPGEVGVVYDETVHMKDLSATLIHFAIKGYMKIVETEKKKLLWGTNKDYEFHKLNEIPADSKEFAEFEKIFFSKIFGTNKIKKISELNKKFYVHLPTIKSTLYKSLVSKKWFTKNPDEERGKYAGLGLVILIGGMILGIVMEHLLLLFSMMTVGVVYFIFSTFMPKKTGEGMKAYESILGLKEYISRAEKDRLDVLNGPNKTTELFESLLPYAMVLGVETEWAKQFEDIYTEAPNWYESNRWNNNFNLGQVLSSFNDLNKSVSTVLPSSPSSSGSSYSSSGGSGFSGGFSGGGFGGGGGGSW